MSDHLRNRRDEAKVHRAQAIDELDDMTGRAYRQSCIAFVDHLIAAAAIPALEARLAGVTVGVWLCAEKRYVSARGGAPAEYDEAVAGEIARVLTELGQHAEPRDLP